MTPLCSDRVFLLNIALARTPPKKSKKSFATRALHRQLLIDDRPKACSYWAKIFLRMSGRGRRADGRIATTVAFIQRCPGSSVPEAIRVYQRWEKVRLLSLSSRFYFCPWVRRAWVQVFDFRCESGKFELDLKKTSWVRKVWVWIKKKLSQESLSLDGQILS